MITPRIPIPQHELADFCRRWQITEFSLFGSVLREDFGPDSDVDVLVTFEPTAKPSLFSLVSMREELSDLFHRSVDVMTRRSVESHHNPWLKHSILSQAAVVYKAA